MAGDFFEDPLPEADLFALGRILHDWSEPKVLDLSKRIFDRLPTGGALLIAEKLLDEDKRGPRWAQMQNLNMLTLAEGKERTFSEYEALLKQVGFSQVMKVTIPSPLDAILRSRSRVESLSREPSEPPKGAGIVQSESRWDRTRVIPTRVSARIFWPIAIADTSGWYEDSTAGAPPIQRLRAQGASRWVCKRDRKKGTGSRPGTAPGNSGNAQVGRVPVPFLHRARPQGETLQEDVWKAVFSPRMGAESYSSGREPRVLIQ